MEKHETVRKITVGQIKELGSAFIEAIPVDLPEETAQYFIEHKGELSRRLQELVFKFEKPGVEELLAAWEKFYLDIFKIEKDFSNLIIPEHKPGFDRLIVVAEGMTPSVIFEKAMELMPTWKYVDDLDGVKSERCTDHDHAIWVRDRVEADEELKNKSAECLAKEGVAGITLEERLVYELKFFKETDGHLDIENITLCAGSRYPDGYVPNVGWNSGRLSVYWYAPEYRRGGLRARAVVF